MTADLPGEGSRSSTRTQAQTALDEREIDDAELEKALSDRERAKGTKNEAAAKFTTLDDVVKGKLEEHDLKVGEPIRVGGFRISKSKSKGGPVSFETKGSERVHINPVAEDE